MPVEPTASLVTEALTVTRLRAGKRVAGASQRLQRRAAMVPPEVTTIAVWPEVRSVARSRRAAVPAALKSGQVWDVGLRSACSTHWAWASSRIVWKERFVSGSASPRCSRLAAVSEWWRRISSESYSSQRGSISTLGRAEGGEGRRRLALAAEGPADEAVRLGSRARPATPRRPPPAGARPRRGRRSPRRRTKPGRGGRGARSACRALSGTRARSSFGPARHRGRPLARPAGLGSTALVRRAGAATGQRTTAAGRARVMGCPATCGPSASTT